MQWIWSCKNRKIWGSDCEYFLGTLMLIKLDSASGRKLSFDYLRIVWELCRVRYHSGGSKATGTYSDQSIRRDAKKILA